MTSTPAVRPRALVVEDELSLRRVLAGYLNADGFEVEVAPDGESALELARALDPDVVVLDLGLPGLDGIEVTDDVFEAPFSLAFQEAANRLPTIKAVMVASFAEYPIHE